MANDKQLIRTLTQPTIILDDLQFADMETGTAPNKGSSETASKPSKQYGGAFPLVMINKFAFQSAQVSRLSLSSSGVRPYVSIEILVTDKSFYSTSFPKDGDLVSVFIRSRTDPFKPIRNDYEITNVNIHQPSGSGENDYDVMLISGTLRIPGFDAVKCFSIKDTSYKAALKVATDLKLGFASNEINTTDTQTWLCPNEKVKNFLDELVLSSWKDEKSFYKYFIDHYYILNYVNVEPLYSEKADIEEAISILRMSHDYGKDSKLHKNLSKTVLSNWDDISSTQFFMSSHALINNSSSVSMRHGYKRYCQYYDALLKENQSLFIDPKTTEGAEKDKQLLKGRPNEDFYKEQINTKWMGVQYGKDGENSHPKYNYAKVNNFQNSAHIEKMGLRVTLPTANFNLRRMQTVPVVIVIKSDTIRKMKNTEIDESQEKSKPNDDEPNRTKEALDAEATPFSIDKTISGFYTIDSIEYVYEKGNFHQECIMYRREWPTPPQTHP